MGIDAGRGVNITGAGQYGAEIGYLLVQGLSVVGPRGTAIADASETLASVKTQLNLVLAFLRGWGAIVS